MERFYPYVIIFIMIVPLLIINGIKSNRKNKRIEKKSVLNSNTILTEIKLLYGFQIILFLEIFILFMIYVFDFDVINYFMTNYFFIIFLIIFLLLTFIPIIQFLSLYYGTKRKNYVIVIDELVDKKLMYGYRGSRYCSLNFKDICSYYNKLITVPADVQVRDYENGKKFFVVYIGKNKRPLVFSTDEYELDISNGDKLINVSELSKYINYRNIR